MLLTSGILSMEDNVLYQTFPNFSASPGFFFKMLAITTSVIFVAALQQRVVFIPLKLMYEMLVATLRALLQGLRWLRSVGAIAAVPPERPTQASSQEDVETYPISTLFSLRRQTTRTLVSQGEPGPPMLPRRAFFPGRHPRSKTDWAQSPV